MTTPTLLNGKALALSRVEVHFFGGSAAKINRIYLWKGEATAFINQTVDRTISGRTNIPITIPNPILGQAIGLSIDVTLESNGWLVLDGASLCLSESTFGLKEVLQDESSEKPLQAELTLNDAA
jgi:hypothetical protein